MRSYELTPGRGRLQRGWIGFESLPIGPVLLHSGSSWLAGWLAAQAERDGIKLFGSLEPGAGDPAWRCCCCCSVLARYHSDGSDYRHHTHIPLDQDTLPPHSTYKTLATMRPTSQVLSGMPTGKLTSAIPKLTMQARLG